MRRIRIKKDLTCVWRVTTNGTAQALAGRDLSLLLIDPKHKKTPLEFTTEGNALQFRVGHDLQPFTGVYSLELWENLGENNQTVVDRTSAFELVRLTTEESDGTADDIAAATADLGTASLAVGVKGDTGATGPQGPQGPAGAATAESIILALGYTPADNADLEDFQSELAGKVTNSAEEGDDAIRIENDDDIYISTPLNNIELLSASTMIKYSNQIGITVDNYGVKLAGSSIKANNKPIATTDQIPDVSGFVRMQTAGGDMSKISQSGNLTIEAQEGLYLQGGIGEEVGRDGLFLRDSSNEASKIELNSEGISIDAGLDFPASVAIGMDGGSGGAGIFGECATGNVEFNAGQSIVLTAPSVLVNNKHVVTEDNVGDFSTEITTIHTEIGYAINAIDSL